MASPTSPSLHLRIRIPKSIAQHDSPPPELHWFDDLSDDDSLPASASSPFLPLPPWSNPSPLKLSLKHSNPSIALRPPPTPTSPLDAVFNFFTTDLPRVLSQNTTLLTPLPQPPHTPVSPLATQSPCGPADFEDTDEDVFVKDAESWFDPEFGGVPVKEVPPQRKQEGGQQQPQQQSFWSYLLSEDIGGFVDEEEDVYEFDDSNDWW
ncbi:hypothetical protein BJ742DRAFT_841484 [Cladochytrium replicatum]|nr:hypothetical protein BJ742DRAFT_841484 [Cladochytrium replicatum]